MPKLVSKSKSPARKGNVYNRMYEHAEAQKIYMAQLGNMQEQINDQENTFKPKILDYELKEIVGGLDPLRHKYNARN